MFEKGSIPENILELRIQQLQNDENSLKMKQESIIQEVDSVCTPAISTEHVRSILSNFKRLFADASFEQKKRLIHALVKNVEIIHDDTTNTRKIGRIQLYFEPEEFQALSNVKPVSTVHRKE